MENELNNIQLRSDEVQEILGHIPSRIIRYGITVIVSVVIVLFIGSFFFKYPDILHAPVEVVTENPPASIVAKVNGNLTEVFIVDSQYVSQNQLLAVVKNSANTDHIKWLQEFVTQLPNNIENWILDSSKIWPDTLVLGSVQGTYSAFLKANKDYRQFLSLKYHVLKIESLSKKAYELEKYSQIMKRQVAIKEKDLQLSKNQFQRDSGLFVKQVISLADYEKSEQSLLQTQLSVENVRSTLVNTTIQIQDLQQQISDLKADETNKKNEHANNIAELFQNLEASIATWFDNYMLISPINGVVAINKVWSANQYVNAGDEIFTVLPNKPSKIIGRINLSVKGAGKVKKEQEVNLKFDNYPYQEFGMVTAWVSSISMVPTEQVYMVEVSLPDTLITNYGYLLPFSQKMLGTAEIITEDLPLIVRLFNPLKAILKKHVGGSKLQKVSSKDENKTLLTFSKKANYKKPPQEVNKTVGHKVTL